MPALIALVLCTVFVLFLLRLEHKQAPDVSRAVWIPTVWMLSTMGKPLGAWFHVQATLETGSSLDRIFLTILLSVSLIILFKRRFEWGLAFRNNPWLMAFYAYMLVSILWSPIPDISFKRWVRELVALVMALLISSEQDPHRAIKSILRKAIYILLPFSLLLIKYYPAIGRWYNPWTGELEWLGVTDQKNQLCLLCVISAFFLLWVWAQRWKGDDLPVTKYQTYAEIFLLFLSFWLLAGPRKTLNYSATSIVTLIFGLLAFAGLAWADKKRVRLGSAALYLIFASIIVYGTVTVFIGKLSLLDMSHFLGRDPTLTGRATNIWPVLIPFAMTRPIAGYGVGGFWTTAMRELTSSNAHSGYLDMLLHFGFLGLGLFFLFIISCARKATMALADDRNWSILSICLILMSLIHNITESSIYTFTACLTALILFFSVAPAKK